ncbi:hypothetical protein NHQ30_006564 [Ciborinia camelliae]|nr:hypothetical protein NHQ30_006564 [Ciborinia camelliae]
MVASWQNELPDSGYSRNGPDNSKMSGNTPQAATQSIQVPLVAPEYNFTILLVQRQSWSVGCDWVLYEPSECTLYQVIFVKPDGLQCSLYHLPSLQYKRNSDGVAFSSLPQMFVRRVEEGIKKWWAEDGKGEVIFKHITQGSERSTSDTAEIDIRIGLETAPRGVMTDSFYDRNYGPFAGEITMYFAHYKDSGETCFELGMDIHVGGIWIDDSVTIDNTGTMVDEDFVIDKGFGSIGLS